MFAVRSRWAQTALFAFSVLGVCLVVAALQSCGAPTPDDSSADGQQQILDAVDVALSTQQCSTAISLILPLYNSTYSDDVIRLKTASAYGCSAGIDFFGLAGQIVTDSAQMAFSGTGTGFWSLLAELFPSTTGQDYKMEGAFYATDALLSVLNPGVLVLPENQVNAGSYNVGSVLTEDRTEDSNLYLLFVAMAGIGTVESRYGYPSPTNFTKTQVLPWTTAAAMNADGCGLAASVLNFFDAVTAAESDLSGNLGNVLTQITQAGVMKYLNNACQYGCLGTSPDGDPANEIIYDPSGTNWALSGATLATPCSTCPFSLRNRSSCTGLATDVNSAAAAGLINFINNSIAGWPGA
jgi:hypothetical protein